MDGMATPSPTPMAALASSRAGSPILAAMGVRQVAKDHHTTPNPSTSFPPTLSAQTPPAICVSKYPQKKELCTNPTVVESQPNSWAMGRMATLRLTRSMLQSRKARKQSVTTVHLLLHGARAAPGAASEAMAQVSTRRGIPPPCIRPRHLEPLASHVRWHGLFLLLLACTTGACKPLVRSNALEDVAMPTRRSKPNTSALSPFELTPNLRTRGVRHGGETVPVNLGFRDATPSPDVHPELTSGFPWVRPTRADVNLVG
eukprot:scaffold408_cov347-Pavlova_lutheri.AAC.49